MLARIILVGLALFAETHVFAERPYADKTDTELTELVSNLDSMDSVSRRALLTEIKGRMRVSGKPTVVRIHTRSRYGRLVRKPDGSVVRIETEQHVVRYRPLSPEEIASKTVEVRHPPDVRSNNEHPAIQKAGHNSREQGFGVGFEQRVSHSKPEAKSE